ncbi:MAG: YigZ family protein [Bacteroidales bacterium]|nr:YigZ family protein [Bacteroidales bacterium]
MLFEDTYKTIEKRTQGYFKDRGSKFYAFAYPVTTEEEIKTILQELRKEYHDARHHCYAYILGFDKSAYRMNDDGEPSGTSGKPIYGQLLSHDLTNTLVVVIRYFGGTKLGIPGLINAYKTATKDALSKNNIITKTVNDVYEIHFEYTDMNNVMKIIKEEKIALISNDYQMDCKIVFSVRKNNTNRVYEKFKKIKGLKIKFLHTE